MGKKFFYILLFLFFGKSVFGGGEVLRFRGLDSLLAFAEKNSLVLKNGQYELLQAKWTRMMAVFNVVNLKTPFGFSMVDNPNLPVSFIPGEVFGGPVGSFRQVNLGQRYVSNFSFAPQIDLLNLELWQRMKNGQLYEKQSELNLVQTKKNLLESVVACFYNIQSFRQQMGVLEQHLGTTDTLLNIVKDKVVEQMARVQELNEMEVQRISITDRLEQLEIGLRQQVLALKVLLDVPLEKEVVVEENDFKKTDIEMGLEARSLLLLRINEVKNKVLKSEYKASKWAMLPTVSLFGSWANQNNSNREFWDGKNNWVYSNFIGLRLVWNVIPDVNRLSKSIQDYYSSKIFALNVDHVRLQNDYNNAQLTLDYQKSLEQLSNAEKIEALKENTYLRNKNLYDASVIDLSKLLLAFQDKLNARLNVCVIQQNLLFYKTKIILNNQIQ